MKCIKCGKGTRVLSTRKLHDGYVLKRTHECTEGHRTHSFQIPPTAYRCVRTRIGPTVAKAKRSAEVLARARIVKRMRDQGKTWAEIATFFGLPRETVRHGL